MSGAGYGDPVAAGGSIVRRGTGRVRSVHALGASTSTALFSGGALLMGVSVRETTGSATVTARLYDGSSINGVQLFSVTVPSAGFEYIAFWDYGLDIEAGLFLQVTSGSADVFAHYRSDAPGLGRVVP